MKALAKLIRWLKFAVVAAVLLEIIGCFGLGSYIDAQDNKALTQQTNHSNRQFKVKHEKWSPNMVMDYAEINRQFDPVDALKDMADSITRTEGYQARYRAFQRYLEEYH